MCVAVTIFMLLMIPILCFLDKRKTLSLEVSGPIMLLCILNNIYIYIYTVCIPCVYHIYVQ